ncbi:hypothetical protein OBBRIDRAFT_733931 [Obba rivulosa]|uniref:Clp1-like protein n=1 Tax=Obba rivulosa TaxID=1052685 RepID=A0A8E2DN01_9APHY|nr:hypothetical protein OBBRIDRAFT_733931 [Obba rivulosa]
MSHHHHHHHHGHRQAPALQLPRRLARPQFEEVSRDAIVALEPDLADVPMEYIRKHLAGQANGMITALNLLNIPSSLPSARLPRVIDVPVRPSASMPASDAFPTHILALSSSRAPSAPTTPTQMSYFQQIMGITGPDPSPTTVPLFAVHALVLTAHCTLLPSLRPTRPTVRGSNLPLPVIPLTVPSVETFHLLHAYLHTRRADQLLKSLLPSLASGLPSQSASTSTTTSYTAQFTQERLVRLAQALVQTAAQQGGAGGALSGLMMHTRVVNGLWRNACALGVFDPELWGVMDIAWEVVLMALNRAVERERA